jgi:hypothetical protein
MERIPMGKKFSKHKGKIWLKNYKTADSFGDKRKAG